jgi:2-oxoglutarate dehydrogenase E2 component (dihydrolipoamide succinyltransferase)
MSVDVAIPEMGESISEVILLEWLKSEGEYVQRDEALCVLETDKANVDLPSPAAGVLHPVSAVDDTLEVGAVIARIDENAEPTTGGADAAMETAVASDGADSTAPVEGGDGAPADGEAVPADDLSPAVRRLITENNLDPSTVRATGPGGRLTKEDVLAHLEPASEEAPAVAAAPAPVLPSPTPEAPSSTPAATTSTPDGVRRVPMTKIRQRIAQHLVAAQHNAAMLTTFNEVDMTEIMALRARHKERFAAVHGVNLGLMSFFSRAVVLALKAFPEVNASIEESDIVYHDYVHLGIAVSTERGLVVPVLRNADQLPLAAVESEIKRLAAAARDNKLGINELSGGTFTITNGGIFGSLLSTPILNAPQCGILGMHTIQKRPVAVDGQVEVRPMMYVALSYDHRLVDGQQSVSFLVRLKESLEDPARMMLEI